MTNEYPEHERLREVHEECDTIGVFLDSTHYVLAEYMKVDGFRDPTLVPVSKSISGILAEYFDIDQKKLEAEKRQMLENIRNV